ncbi:MAG: hypothetical protein JNL69_11305 [Bacteroidia bacterium]|nr:hypothetical protein [Bacteroidia bacterium]
MNKKKLILSLIKDSLINAKLVNGLNEMGLNADNYFLHLNDTVFNLMGYDDNEETEQIFELFVELSKRAMFIDISQSHKPLDDLALQIYIELSTRKPNH